MKEKRFLTRLFDRFSINALTILFLLLGGIAFMKRQGVFQIIYQKWTGVQSLSLEKIKDFEKSVEGFPQKVNENDDDAFDFEKMLKLLSHYHELLKTSVSPSFTALSSEDLLLHFDWLEAQFRQERDAYVEYLEYYRHSSLSEKSSDKRLKYYLRVLNHSIENIHHFKAKINAELQLTKKA